MCSAMCWRGGTRGRGHPRAGCGSAALAGNAAAVERLFTGRPPQSTLPAFPAACCPAPHSLPAAGGRSQRLSRAAVLSGGGGGQRRPSPAVDGPCAAPSPALPHRRRSPQPLCRWPPCRPGGAAGAGVACCARPLKRPCSHCPTPPSPARPAAPRPAAIFRLVGEGCAWPREHRHAARAQHAAPHVCVTCVCRDGRFDSSAVPQPADAFPLPLHASLSCLRLQDALLPHSAKLPCAPPQLAASASSITLRSHGEEGMAGGTEAQGIRGAGMEARRRLRTVATVGGRRLRRLRWPQQGGGQP